MTDFQAEIATAVQAGEETGAEVLRRAAGLMRERAEAATDERATWFTPTWLTESTAEIIDGRDAAHIASWHPAVALAVADWLEASVDVVDAETRDRCGPGLGTRNALKVARAYLGDPA